jgi:CHAD domain-containing protein
MGVPPTAHVAFGGDQHVLAERREMMSANWAAVRRRLAVRRAANRPPRRGGQLGHASIVAPLAATIAASVVAVGVGVALAQAERTRRSAQRLRKRERRFTQLPGEPLPEALQRMMLGQLGLAIELLGGDVGDGGGGGSDRENGSVTGRPTPNAKAIHDTRKALKRLRALVRLLRAELGEQQYKREHAILRDAARRLAGARDAEVMVGTLDAMLKRHPRKLGRRRHMLELRKLLVAERAAAELATFGDSVMRGEVLRELSGLRERVRQWNLPERPGIALVEHDLRRIYRDGRERKQRIARRKGGSGTRGKGEARGAHEWRKRVKDLRYASEILGLRSIARRADRLGELLGEEHDLVVLASLLPPPGRAPFKGKRGKRARKALLKRIARRRRQLHRRALREGERLYRHKPKRFARRSRRAHAQGRDA